LSSECVSAGLFDFFEIFRNQRVELALIRIFAVNGAAVVDLARFLGFLNQKRTFEENLAAGPAPRAFAVAAFKQRLILSFIDVRSDETADLARRLPGAKLEPG
jgi:hypothetical protein